MREVIKNKYKSKKPDEMCIIDSYGKNLFDIDSCYVIPLYQREFAWGEMQLTQLIEDILDTNDTPGAKYYIGSLIVSKHNNMYEVVDGQQRLTSFYILLNCLENEVKHTLKFECRDKSNYTLENIKNIICNESELIDEKKIEINIFNGIKILNDILNKKKFDKNQLVDKLKRVVIYRIEVPENTDLNRYFEIMNTRGEQLEQTDILKAKLMANISNIKDRSIFALIWDACNDMNGYVQMHFVSKDNIIRDGIFSSKWNKIPSSNWKEYERVFKNISEDEIDEKNCKINDIINNSFEVKYDDYKDNDKKIRFKSIIEFSVFLLHVLKVMINAKDIKHKDGKENIIAEQLDDKRLLTSFENVIENGVYRGKGIFNNKEWFSKEFIICLLQSRYLFDKYIVKREVVDETSDGEWSLQKLEVSGTNNERKPYYNNTIGKLGKDNTNKVILMLQSALRVSYTSPKIMHWITRTLIYLYRKNDSNLDDFDIYIENDVKDAVKKNFIDVCEKDKYEMGVDTPHIVFNYLDFLLWKNNKEKYDDFKFEFRNSVEHWYPQNPSGGTFDKWEKGEGVDRFGNLCIIQRDTNSKFSNLNPVAKKETFKNLINKGSLKLRIMSHLTTDCNEWKNKVAEEHEQEMIKLLKEGVL